MKTFFDSHRGDLDAIRDYPFANPEAYAQFLAQTRHYVVHTTRLLGVTAGRIGEEREKLHNRFMQHAAEERSHHLLADHDLPALMSQPLSNKADIIQIHGSAPFSMCKF